ncbi:MAG: (2Fe-2S) ferredoxin domain-containing protein [Spirochaetes bacterium]|nr:(2Fe-2S) ferredoxin domain-containing protein [Spirochaetota bacterium]
MGKKSLEELRKLREIKMNDMRKREGEHKDTQIIVGMGTCGIAAGAKKTLEFFLKSVDEAKLVDSVLPRQVGCMGHCHSEPTVKVVVPGMPEITYGSVDVNAAKEIFDSHIVGKKIVENRVLAQPVAGAK